MCMSMRVMIIWENKFDFFFLKYSFEILNQKKGQRIGVV